MALLNTYSSYMPLGSINPVLQNIHEVSSTANHKIGDLLALADGRRFRYAKTYGTTVIKGKCVANSLSTSVVAGITCAVNHPTAGTYAVGTISITIDAMTDASTVTFAADELVGGYLVTGVVGDTYPIVSNTAVASNGCTIQLGEGLRVSLADNVATLRVVPSPFAAVTSTYTAASSFIAGVSAVTAATSGSYIWVQTKGIVGAYTTVNTDITIGTFVEAGDNGIFDVVTTGDITTCIGRMAMTNATTTVSDVDGWYPIYLTLE